jgi:type III secretion system TyeA family effector delivery regulator
MVNEKAHQLMRDILPLMEERWIDGAKIRAIADRLHLRTDEARIYFLRELLALVRRFPLKIYKDDEARQRLIIAVQEALDAAIEEEEA